MPENLLDDAATLTCAQANTAVPVKTLADLPYDVLLIIVDLIVACAPMQDRVERHVRVPSQTAWTLFELRRVSRAWSAAIDAPRPSGSYHVDLSLDVVYLKGVTYSLWSCRVCWQFVANGNNRHSAAIIVLPAEKWTGRPNGEPQMAELLSQQTINALDDARALQFVPVPHFSSNDRFSLVAVDLITALRLSDTRVAHCGQLDNPQGASTMIRKLAVSLPKISWLHLTLQVHHTAAPAVVSALATWSATLTTLNLNLWLTPCWNKAAKLLELPHLHTLTVRIEWGFLETLPKAPKLTLLSVTAPSVHPSAIAQHARTLRSLMATITSNNAYAPIVPIPAWPELRKFKGPSTLFFQIAGGSPSLSVLKSLMLVGSLAPRIATASLPFGPCLNLTALHAELDTIMALASCLVAPQLAKVVVRIVRPESVFSVLPWLSICSLSISSNVWSPIPISGIMLDELVNLTMLSLPERIVWVDDIVPILASVKHLIALPGTFATFPDCALPSLKHAKSAWYYCWTDQSSRFNSLPAACASTLQRISGCVSMRIVEFLTCMSQFKDANVALNKYDEPLAEWRLTYVQGNELWNIIPSVDLQRHHSELKTAVHKLVVDLRKVDDLDRMTKEITNMARWCVECRPWVGKGDAAQVRESQRDPFPLEVRVPVNVVETEVLKHIEAMVQELAVDGIVGQVIVVAK
ncbi:hypothetical protein AMAG_13526 [Allomyces macrogynus ATCC 38327]|uniref:F-box domain-containing protein n=1 Tax=Allomyces macrogynus (strain ATCC 38327) TaxID=578462 RepID=A0A0L0T206_ALLM3|nr:hypothetical protein AMAG_13526 [Allomyces macrogynus ATCC 38327]|eukprot:KNE68888.1 hypothetical protein AMAG_13526 [Allomyces macrogynus ATCC 38327]